MLLRKLEIYGFKSFADKTDIEFGRGVTAIVGPNGSGKSNITDAIRWVLGEQSIRTLRGARLEDVIFTGSSSRRQMGVAEVSLMFDNSDGLLPIDFNEVTITRRAFRSGDSEYYINKSSCRLKDIHDLLAGTGLGRDAMAVIGQNKIDEVLNSKPEERRLFFEEAAGITKYKQRKKEALRKLEETAQNVTRVEDITAEIDSRLGPLAESAARTTQYNQMHQQLVEAQIQLLAIKLSKAKKMMDSITLQRQALTDEEIGISTDISVKETQREKLTAVLGRTEEELTGLSERVNQARTDLERTDGQIAVLNERITQAGHARQRLQEDRNHAEILQKELDHKLAAAQTALAEKSRQEVELAQQVSDATLRLNDVNDQINRYERQLEEGKEKTFDHLQEIVNERNLIAEADRDLARLNTRQGNYRQEAAEYSSQLVQAQARSAEFEKEQQALDESFAQLQHAAGAAVKAKRDIEQKLSVAVAEDRRLNAQLNEMASRFKVLHSMQQEYEGFGRGVRSVLKSQASWRKGICGTVAHIIKVEDQYVVALQIALGGALQHVITENEDLAQQAVGYLKNHNLGRATFLPLTTVKPIKPREMEVKASRLEGSLGFAAGLITCREKYNHILDYLLGRTIIAKNMEAAYKIARYTGFSTKIVTLDGEVLSPGGSLTGGSIGRRDASLLSRSNELETLSQNMEKVKQLLLEQQAEMDKYRESLATVTAQLDEHNRLRQNGEVRRAELKVLAEKSGADIHRLKLACATVTAEIEGCELERRQLTEKRAAAQCRIDGLQNRDVQHKELLQEWQQKLEKLTGQREEANAAVTDNKIELAALRQGISSLAENAGQLAADVQSATAHAQALAIEDQKLADQEKNATRQLTELSEQRATLHRLIAETQDHHRQLYAVKLETLSSAQQADRELKELRRKHDDLQRRLHEVEIMSTKYTYEVNRCLEELKANFSYSESEIQAVSTEGDPSHIAAAIARLETAIEDLGPVNHAAIEEYEKLKERHDFLQSQYNDLMKAKEYLSAIIGDIDRTMAKQFNAAFQEINTYFSDIFVQLFGGGKAYLQLSEPANLLETGIDVIVQPPGKKLQNLVLLSGGERALTVIALLFAFLSYRPTPFVVVDEIDAALDEANLRRFSKFLRDYSQNTQFIVVTHRKGTMEAADVMHGITIEEAGISHLVSVKFTEKAG